MHAFTEPISGEGAKGWVCLPTGPCLQHSEGLASGRPLPARGTLLLVVFHSPLSHVGAFVLPYRFEGHLSFSYKKSLLGCGTVLTVQASLRGQNGHPKEVRAPVRDPGLSPFRRISWTQV